MSAGTNDFTASEQETLAFLQKAGVKMYDTSSAPATSDAQEVSASEAETRAFLQRAGVIPATQSASPMVDKPWNR